MVRLFDGDISLTEILHMDLPMTRAWVEARLKRLQESQKNYEKNGIIDSYSRRYMNSMSPFGMHASPSSSPASESSEDEAPPPRKSLNVRPDNGFNPNDPF